MQADRGLVIDLHCPLPHGRGSVRAFRHGDLHGSSSAALGMGRCSGDTLGCPWHRGRYRYWNRSRSSSCAKPDCEGDCDPDSNADGPKPFRGVLSRTSLQSMWDCLIIPHAKGKSVAAGIFRSIRLNPVRCSVGKISGRHIAVEPVADPPQLPLSSVTDAASVRSGHTSDSG